MRQGGWQRRRLLGQALAGWAGIGGLAGLGPAVAAPGAAAGRIGQQAAVRVIVDNDFAGDPDGLFALAHQWLSPTARTVLVTSSALDARLAALAGEPAGRTAAKGRDQVLQLARAGKLGLPCPVLAGAEGFGVGAAQVSPAARAIVDEALRDDPLPLWLTCGGPLTNVAAALRLAPQIAPRLTLVWIGGALDGRGEPEYNLATDVEAARQVLWQPGLAVRVVPREAYRQLTLSVAELEADLRPISALGDWLHGRYLQLPPFLQLGPTVTLGDSALVQAAVLDRQGPLRPVPAQALLPRPDGAATGMPRELLLCERIEARAVIADLLAKLRLQAAVSKEKT
ncbi:MAG: nucleoside hydrolase [Burkholderiaceae bacterium]|nr:nucleoside hydrolase [Burkholderiaceae bacterium]